MTETWTSQMKKKIISQHPQSPQSGPTWTHTNRNHEKKHLYSFWNKTKNSNCAKMDFYALIKIKPTWYGNDRSNQEQIKFQKTDIEDNSHSNLQQNRRLGHNQPQSVSLCWWRISEIGNIKHIQFQSSFFYFLFFIAIIIMRKQWNPHLQVMLRSSMASEWAAIPSASAFVSAQ